MARITSSSPIAGVGPLYAPTVEILPSRKTVHLFKRAPGNGGSRKASRRASDPPLVVAPFPYEVMLKKADQKSTFHHNMKQAFPKPGPGSYTIKDHGALEEKWAHRWLAVDKKAPELIEKNLKHYKAKEARLTDMDEKTKAARYRTSYQQLFDEAKAAHAQRNGLR